MSYITKSPVLLIAFNRPQTTKIVFEAIRKARPKKLFVAIDGPRTGNSSDIDLCKQVGEIFSSIDWDCEIKTNFRTNNLGCGLGPKKAIDWFFSHCNEGIILEDDCLPTQSFFEFCDELLELYRDNNKIFLISGSNPIPQKSNPSYIFSTHGGIWGWATWKRAWDKYDWELKEWFDPLLREKALSRLHPNEKTMLINGINNILNGKVKAWDYQWYFYRNLYESLGIIPSKNLISNIGFGPTATHTLNKNSPLAFQKTNDLPFPLKHPKKIEINKYYEVDFKSLNIQEDKKIISRLSRIYRKLINKIL